jgi:hypothetical protein
LAKDNLAASVFPLPTPHTGLYFFLGASEQALAFDLGSPNPNDDKLHIVFPDAPLATVGMPPAGVAFAPLLNPRKPL